MQINENTEILLVIFMQLREIAELDKTINKIK